MKGLCLFACVLSLALARAEDKWVFAIRYFQEDRDVAEMSNLVVRAAKTGYTGLALVSERDYTGNWWDADLRRSRGRRAGGTRPCGRGPGGL